jgi:hypothetical protein
MTAEAILEIRNALARAFNEALKTHGPALAIAGAACFAAGAVHHAEHLIVNEPNARWIVLGRWTDNFHAQLDHLNRHCDDQQRLADQPRADGRWEPPSGLA